MVTLHTPLCVAVVLLAHRIGRRRQQCPTLVPDSIQTRCLRTTAHLEAPHLLLALLTVIGVSPSEWPLLLIGTAAFALLRRPFSWMDWDLALQVASAVRVAGALVVHGAAEEEPPLRLWTPLLVLHELILRECDIAEITVSRAVRAGSRGRQLLALLYGVCTLFLTLYGWAEGLRAGGVRLLLATCLAQVATRRLLPIRARVWLRRCMTAAFWRYPWVPGKPGARLLSLEWYLLVRDAARRGSPGELTQVLLLRTGDTLTAEEAGCDSDCLADLVSSVATRPRGDSARLPVFRALLAAYTADNPARLRDVVGLLCGQSARWTADLLEDLSTSPGYSTAIWAAAPCAVTYCLPAWEEATFAPVRDRLLLRHPSLLRPHTSWELGAQVPRLMHHLQGRPREERLAALCSYLNDVTRYHLIADKTEFMGALLSDILGWALGYSHLLPPAVIIRTTLTHPGIAGARVTPHVLRAFVSLLLGVVRPRVNRRVARLLYHRDLPAALRELLPVLDTEAKAEAEALSPPLDVLQSLLDRSPSAAYTHTLLALWPGPRHLPVERMRPFLRTAEMAEFYCSPRSGVLAIAELLRRVRPRALSKLMQERVRSPRCRALILQRLGLATLFGRSGSGSGPGGRVTGHFLAWVAALSATLGRRLPVEIVDGHIVPLLLGCAAAGPWVGGGLYHEVGV